MATKEQYEFFRTLYADEEKRYEQLENRAKLFLSVISVLVVSILFKASEVQVSTRVFGIAWPLMVLEAALLVGALVSVVLAAQMRDYEAVADPRAIIESFGHEPPTNEDFFDRRIADLTVATERNVSANDSMARRLTAAGWLLAGAVAVLVVALLTGFLTSQEGHRDGEKAGTAAQEAQQGSQRFKATDAPSRSTR